MTSLNGDWGTWLGLLDAADDVELSVGYQPPGGRFEGRRITAAELRGLPGPPAGANYWVGVVALNGGSGRGSAEHAKALLGIWADLDAEPGKCGDLATCGAILSDLEGMLGRRATWLTRTGHGLQPVWRMDEHDGTPVDEQVSLLKRFGVLVATVAESHGAQADSVFDAARILRAPGGTNWKIPEEPVPVGFSPGSPGRTPWSVLRGVLDANGVPEVREAAGEALVLDPAWWTDGEPCRAAREALDRAAGEFGGERHPKVLISTTALARLGEQGHQGTKAALMELLGIFTAAATDPRRKDRRTPARAKQEFAEAVRTIKLKGATPEGDKGCCGSEIPDAAVLVAESFWERTPVLRHIRQAADSQMLAPMGLLGAVLARLSFVTHVKRELPAMPNRGSLNYFAGLVGAPGAGKSSIIYQAERLVPTPGFDCECGEHAQYSVVPQGSGEGLVHSYFELVQQGRRRVNKRDRDHVLVIVDEIETLLQIGSRASSTIGAVLRSAWSGSECGFSNAASDRRVILPGGSYRVALIAGVQPDRARALFDEAAGGTPQRFVWFQCSGQGAGIWDIEEQGDPPVWPGDLGDLATQKDGGPWKALHVGVDPAIMREVQVEANKVRRGMSALAEMDQHRVFARLRTAALLALLHREDEVTAQWWGMAGEVMAASDAVRGAMLERMKQAAAEEIKKQGVTAANREFARLAVTGDRVEQLAVRLGELAEKKGRVTRRDLSQTAGGRDRYLLNEAISLAEELDLLTPGGDGKSWT